MTDPVADMLAAHGFSGPWIPSRATGLANRVYATADVVLRVATDHPEAVPDARTESVAAPAAREAGIRTPRLLAFDDSRALVNRPFSIWERVHGETLGCAGLDIHRRERVWHEVGDEIAKLHSRIRACADPHGYLDTPPTRHITLSVGRLIAAHHQLTTRSSSVLRRLLPELLDDLGEVSRHRFLARRKLYIGLHVRGRARFDRVFGCDDGTSGPVGAGTPCDACA